MQFGVAVDDFLQFCAIERQLSQHTIKAYASDLADFRRCLSTGALASDVSAATLKHYLEQMVVQRQLAPATVRRRLACLRAFFRRLIDLSQAPDPFANWRPAVPRKKRLPRTLSRYEIASLLSSIQ